jgi:hypothetical protein
MAADQRYCLECGRRRGEPRLPFMDAVVFMEAIRKPAATAAAPPPPREQRSRMTANASLIAGVATLVLAIGVGVMIGQSGDSGGSTASAPAPQIIKVGGADGEETASAANSGGGEIGGQAKGKKTNAPEKAIDSSGTSEAAAEVLKPAGDVKLPPPTVKPGGKCESGAAGCEDGEFTGEFFGE